NDYDKFINISVFQNACCMCILQVGELCKVVSEELKEQKKTIPWKEWCGIRDIFAHQYSNLDCQSAWDTIQNDLPQLKIEIERILKEMK
ncbi:MAG: HepT-like ribonuclease domain-containing protein, partial [Lachnospiraceae bacterium]|nr:HepT-like ribonuclease domain-containing protein [Lachnospiraceae bacterium]